MKTNTLSLLIFIITLIGTSKDLACQEEIVNNTNSKRNSVELYYNISHFFDGTKTNWIILDYYTGHLIDTTGHVINTFKKYYVPVTVGIQYNRSIKNCSDIRISALYYYRDYGIYKNSLPGEVIKRSFVVLSLSYLNNLMLNKHLKIQAIGELNYRNGYEIINMYYPSGFETILSRLRLSDIGITAGLRVEHSLPYNFLISGEAKYTRFVYRASKGIDFLGQHKDTTPNTLTIKLGIGYRF